MKRVPELVAAALLAVGLVGGACSDPRPARPEVRRAGYRVLEGDFHVHTTWSDGMLTPTAIVRQASRRGLDVVAVTEHNGVTAGKIARAVGRLGDGPIVLAGEEITSANFHLIAVGLEHTVDPGGGSVAAVAAVHAQGGVIFAAHPVEFFWPSLVPIRAELDGAERMHPLALRERKGPWSYPSMIRFYDEASPRLGAIGSSDFHAGSVLGICRTLVFVKEPASEASVMEALRARRTVVIGTKGELVGDPEMVAALEREPYVPRTSDYAYRGEGAGDRVTRAIGLVGVLMALLVLGKRRANEAQSAAT